MRHLRISYIPSEVTASSVKLLVKIPFLRTSGGKGPDGMGKKAVRALRVERIYGLSRPIPRHQGALAGTIWRLGLMRRRPSGRMRPRCSILLANFIKTSQFSTAALGVRPPLLLQREIGDVLLTWENEAFLALKKFGANKFQILAPPQSILTEASVSVVDKIRTGKRLGVWRKLALTISVARKGRI